MASRYDLNRITQAIQGMPEFAGCRIGYQGSIDGGAPMSMSLYDGATPSLNYAKVIVIIEVVEMDDPAIDADTGNWAAAPRSSPDGTSNPLIITNRSKVGREALGAGLSCGLAIVSAVGVFGSAAAEIPSGGTSTFLLVASWTGMVTSGVQCLNGLGRLGVIAYDPQGDQLERLDRNTAYSATMLVVDGLGIVSGLAGLPAAGKNLFAILSRQRSFVARGLTEAALKEMNQAERAAVIAQAVQEASRTPEGLEAIIKAAREAQVGAASIQRGTLSVRNATRMVGVISAETAKRLNRTVLSIVSTAVGVGASSMNAQYVGSASGSLNWIINLIDVGGGTST
jgi:hypothetical protein